MFVINDLPIIFLFNTSFGILYCIRHVLLSFLSFENHHLISFLLRSNLINGKEVAKLIIIGKKLKSSIPK